MRNTMRDNTCASTGPTGSTRSTSLLLGAICSNAMICPSGLRNGRNDRLVSSSSSSIRTPVWRRTSTMAQVQNARSSALLRSTRRPFRSIAVTSCSVNERRRRSGLGPLRHCSSATTNVESASADVAAASRWSTRSNCAASELISWGSTGDRARVRALISAICRRRRRGAVPGGDDFVFAAVCRSVRCSRMGRHHRV